MIDVTSIDARPGEAEIVALMATYMAARLFTPRQRKSLSVIVDLTGQPVRVPVTRAMLGPQKMGLGTRPPKQFEMTVSTAAGIRDAAEVVAHELLHISQAVNGRLVITSMKRKINGVKKIVDTARWMGGKPVMIDELAWQHRPWEIEACAWQGQLVTEFLMLTTGQYVDQPVQKPKKRQLALYPVRVPAPSVSLMPREPEFAPAPPEVPTGETGSLIGSNGASIDSVIANAMPQPAPQSAAQSGMRSDEAMPAAEQAASGRQENQPEDHLVKEMVQDRTGAPAPGPVTHADALNLTEDAPQAAPIQQPDDALMADLAADLAIGTQPGGSFGGADQPVAPIPQTPFDHGQDGGGQETDQRAGQAVDQAPGISGMRNRPVYDKSIVDDPEFGRDPGVAADLPHTSVIEVEVPGLDSPRALERVAMTRKLDELRGRGLAGA
ncbi:MAG: hypothetical protein ACON31_10465 [Candidatus Puniceispirillaceae bacterium]